MIGITITRSQCAVCRDQTTFIAIDGGPGICSRSHRPDEQDSLAQLQRNYDDAATDNTALRRRLAEAQLRIEVLESQLKAAGRREKATIPDLPRARKAYSAQRNGGKRR